MMLSAVQIILPTSLAAVRVLVAMVVFVEAGSLPARVCLQRGRSRLLLLKIPRTFSSTGFSPVTLILRLYSRCIMQVQVLGLFLSRSRATTIKNQLMSAVSQGL
jgi:hypothetical protein